MGGLSLCCGGRARVQVTASRTPPGVLGAVNATAPPPSNPQLFPPLASPPSVSASVQQVHAHLKACVDAAHVRTWAGSGNCVRAEARRLTSSST